MANSTHHRRLHHRQRRRGDHLPDGGVTRSRARRRGLGRRLQSAAGCSLAGSHQAGTVHISSSPRSTGADAGRHRRRPQGRRAETGDRAGKYKASSRRRSTASTSATISKASRQVRRAITSSTSRIDTIGGALQELEDVLHMSQPGPAGWSCARAVPLHPGPEHQARSVRTERRPRCEVGDGDGRLARVASTLSSTTGTCCPSASNCGGASFVLREVPALQRRRL